MSLTDRTYALIILLAFGAAACDSGRALSTDAADAGAAADVPPLADATPLDAAHPDARTDDAGSAERADAIAAADASAADASPADASRPDVGDPSRLPPGGIISLSLSDSLRWGNATFYTAARTNSGADPQPLARAPITTDTCTRLGDGPIGIDEIRYTYRDVGSEVVVSGGGESFRYARSTGGGVILYDFAADFQAMLPPWAGGTLSVEVSGSAAVPGTRLVDVLDVPASDLRLTSTEIMQPLGAPNTQLVWTPAGASFVEVAWLDMRADDIVSLCRCEVRDDGEFTVPPVGCLENSSGGVLVGVAAHVFQRDVELGGRRVRLDVLSGPQVTRTRTP